jgi:hypothetical protein
MRYFKKIRIICVLILIEIILVSGFLLETSKAGCPDMVTLAERALRNKGINTDNDDEIIKASQSKDVLIRHDAIMLLEAKLGKKGIPALKHLLNDDLFGIRLRAAHSLAMLGDESGHERMIKDFEQYRPKEEPNDPNILNDSKALNIWRRDHGWDVSGALQIGKVLAEYGDFRAFELAVNTGLSNDLGYNRWMAAEVMGEIGKRDTGELKEDAVAVLCRMAETDENITVFRAVRMAAEKIGVEAEIQILEKAITNPNQAEYDMRIARTALWTAKKKMQRNLGTVVEPNSSSEPNNPPK